MRRNGTRLVPMRLFCGTLPLILRRTERSFACAQGPAVPLFAALLPHHPTRHSGACGCTPPRRVGAWSTPRGPDGDAAPVEAAGGGRSPGFSEGAVAASAIPWAVQEAFCVAVVLHASTSPPSSSLVYSLSFCAFTATPSTYVEAGEAAEEVKGVLRSGGLVTLGRLHIPTLLR